MSLSLNPAVDIHPLDAATDQAMVICEVPAQGDSSLRYALPAELLELLKLFDGRRPTEEVVAAYAETYPARYTADKIVKLIDSFLLPRSLLIDLDKPGYLPGHGLKRPSYVYAKFRLIPGSVVCPVARALGWPFRKSILAASALLFITLHLFFYLWILPHHPVNFAELTGPRMLLVAFLSLVAAFIHEMGHASALVRYGCRRTEIGVGLYIYFPVLYTDVSEAWKLSRLQRAMIDIGGVYFQSVCFPVLLGVFWLTGSSLPLFTFIVLDLVISRTLNPFLRMDGYWLLADLFGIFNLRQQSLKLLRHYALKLINRKAALPPLNLSRNAKLALCAYTVLCVVFFLHLCTIMFYQTAYNLLPNYPTRLLTLWHVAQANPLSVTKLLSTFFEVLWRSIALFGLSWFSYRLLRGTWGFLKTAVRAVWEKLSDAQSLQERTAERL